MRFMLFRRLFPLLTFVLAVGAAFEAVAANRFVSSDGTWVKEGIEGTCYASLQDATAAAAKGDVIWVKNDFVCSAGTNSTTYLSRVSDQNRAIVIRGEDDDPWNGPVVDGGDVIRCFYLNAGSTLIGFTARNGRAIGTRGGGIYLGSSKAVVSNCVVTGCLAEGEGGGIYSSLSTAQILNCDVLRNETSGSNATGSNGGGVYNATIVDSRIVSNQQYKASGTTSATGGGGVGGGTATCCLIACNTAGKSGRASDGGGTYGTKCYGCLITNNYAYGFGGGMVGGWLVDSTNMFNTGGRGGACYETEYATNSVIVCNTARAHGGGIALQDTSASAKHYYDCIVTNNRSSTSSCGGGVWTNIRSIDIFTRCTIAFNSNAKTGGGAYGGTYIDCEIVSNTAYAAGGVWSASCYGCTIEGNVASGATGSGTVGYGGYGGGADNSKLYTCQIVGNKANYNGGGTSASVLSNCTVACNESAVLKGMTGGAVYGGTASSCWITNNVSHGQTGGGCREATTYNCVITGNVNEEWTTSSVGRGGGGVYGGTHYNALIANNSSGSQGAAAAFATLYNCTVYGNAALNPNAGAQLLFGGYNSDGNVLVNTIVWGNTNATGAVTRPTSFINAASNSCLEVTSLDNAKYVDCVNRNPRFADVAQGDFHPRAKACRNAGITFAWMTDSADVRSKDLDGRPRIIGSAPDMGCCETTPQGLQLLVR